MPREPRYDILFEPVSVGPHTARNRFYQVPHCNGMGWLHPTSMAVMRGIKAEGGWAVVSTEECDIHPTAEAPHNRVMRLWDDKDMPALERMVDLVHAHRSLAAIELVHAGYQSANYASREIPLAPSGRPAFGYHPVQARTMDKEDITELRRWHRAAALRAQSAGFDIVYVYASHDLGLPLHFLSRRHNRRHDGYGGSLANRARLLRELIEDTKDAVGDTCAVAVRLSIDGLTDPDGVPSQEEARDLFALLGDLPDLWDITRTTFADDMTPSRFYGEGSQEEHVRFIKEMTSRPVVGVGRFTSPDAMVSQIRRGLIDFIGAARPSIADPFLPRKIEEGRVDAIRECIGCNMCLASDEHAAPMRCTQNPTAGEEWRSGWHPERIAARTTDDRILVVGAGPAGLEAARALGQRGYEVVVAEAAREPGGRVSRESRLPGLAEWARVRDYRVGQISTMPNVELYLESDLAADDVREAECSLVALATGAAWRRDGMGRNHDRPIAGCDAAHVLTPDDIMDGATTRSSVIVYDDDHYYMGSALAEQLALDGRAVTLVTPAPLVSAWTEATAEQHHIQARLIALGVTIVSLHLLHSVRDGLVELACFYSGKLTSLECGSVVLVTSRSPNEKLYRGLVENGDLLSDAGIRRIARIGDCYGPGTIAAAVHGGHRFARELGSEATEGILPHRELPELAELGPQFAG